MGNAGHTKPYIDVMENVFGGVHISTDDERGGSANELDLRARPWLSGISLAAVQVRLTREGVENDGR